MRHLKIHLKLRLILVLILSVFTTVKAFPPDNGYKDCEYTVNNWVSSSLNSEVNTNKHELRDLLFFLHIPRTGGRSYLHCFLKKLYSNSQKCPQSYDKLRFNQRKTNCRLLSTHDDYSVTSKLPNEKTSIVTILRDPIDRIFSTYEFSIEVAARFLIHQNLTSVARTDHRVRRKKTGVSTLDIWPWKYLVPWMREDLFARRDARKFRGTITNNSSYDMDDILMPLREYITHPIAREIVHNGATFQIAGLTNNSYIGKSHEVRHCVLKYQTLGKYVLQVAKKRLDAMLYVGITENHRESATMFANVVGTQVISRHKTSEFAEQSPLMAKLEGNDTYQKLNEISSTGEDGAASEKNLTASKLIESYESCISNLRNSQSERRMKSLKQIKPVNFTKEARRKVPEALIQEIKSLNSLDLELYSYAKEIFAKQQARMMEQSMVNTQESLSNTSPGSPYGDSYSTRCLRFLFLPLTLLLVFLFVNSRRRTFKVKL